MQTTSYRAMILRLTQIHDHLDDIAVALSVAVQKAPSSYAYVGPLDTMLIDFRSAQGRLRTIIEYIKPAADHEAATE